MLSCYNRGIVDAKAGLTELDCPYGEDETIGGILKCEMWRQGFLDAHNPKYQNHTTGEYLKDKPIYEGK